MREKDKSYGSADDYSVRHGHRHRIVSASALRALLSLSPRRFVVGVGDVVSSTPINRKTDRQ